MQFLPYLILPFCLFVDLIFSFVLTLSSFGIVRLPLLVLGWNLFFLCFLSEIFVETMRASESKTQTNEKNKRVQPYFLPSGGNSL